MFVYFVAGALCSHHCCQAHLGTLQRLPSGFLQDNQPSCQEAFCPVCQGGGQQHRQLGQNHQGSTSLPVIVYSIDMDLVLTVMSIVIDGSFWNMSSNFSQGFVLYSSLTGTLTQLDLLFHLPPFLGFRWWFLRGEQEQVSSCHSSTNRGCGKPNNICFQPRVCQHPSSNQQRGTAVWTFSVCRIHVQLLRAFF